MKKCMALLLILIFSLSLCACEKKEASILYFMVGGEKIHLKDPQVVYYPEAGKPGEPKALTVDQALKLERLLKNQTYVRINRVYPEKPGAGSIMIQGKGEKAQGFCFYAQVWQETPSAPKFVYVKPRHRFKDGEASFQVHGNVELVAQIKEIACPEAKPNVK